MPPRAVATRCAPPTAHKGPAAHTPNAGQARRDARLRRNPATAAGDMCSDCSSPGAPAIADDRPQRDAAAGVDLRSGETIILAVKPHWLLFFASVLPILLGVALASFILLGVQLSFGPSIVRPVGVGVALVGALGVLAAYFEHRNRLYLLTDRRVIRRAGVVRVSVAELPLPEVDTAVVQKNPAGDTPDRVGILIFSGPAGKLAWEFVPEPRNVCAAAREAIHRYGARPRTRA